MVLSDCLGKGLTFFLCKLFQCRPQSLAAGPQVCRFLGTKTLTIQTVAFCSLSAYAYFIPTYCHVCILYRFACFLTFTSGVKRDHLGNCGSTNYCPTCHTQEVGRQTDTQVDGQPGTQVAMQVGINLLIYLLLCLCFATCLFS